MSTIFEKLAICQTAGEVRRMLAGNNHAVVPGEPSVKKQDNSDDIELNDCGACRHEVSCYNEERVCNEHKFAEPKTPPA